MHQEVRCPTIRSGSGWSCLAVDAHAHLYDGVSSLEIAAGNIVKNCPEAQTGVLLLAERMDEQLFLKWRSDPPRGLHQTSEPIALYYDAGALPLLIIAGRQIVTAESIELLLLGTLDFPRDNDSLAKTLAARSGGGLAVLPWGFGKWIGQRGASVASALKSRADLFAGDIQARPSWLPSPTLRRAGLSGRPVLAGTDSLPMASDNHRIGGFGQVVCSAIDPQRPAASLLQALQNPGHRTYGRRASLAMAMRQQLAWYRSRRRAA